MAQSTSRTDSAGGVPGLPREGGGAPLSGRVVLLPRLKERDRIASALERAGARVLRAAVTRTVPGEAAVLEATARRIAAGEAAWLVLTSAGSVLTVGMVAGEVYTSLVLPGRLMKSKYAEMG